MSVASICKIARTTPSILFDKSYNLCQCCPKAYICGPKKGSGNISGTYLSKHGHSISTSSQSVYDCHKYSHSLPNNEVTTRFAALPCIPTGVFRSTDGEQKIGPGAAKCGFYQQVEYFCYHHMTFYDLHLMLKPCRQPAPNTKRKP